MLQQWWNHWWAMNMIDSNGWNDRCIDDWIECDGNRRSYSEWVFHSHLVFEHHVALMDLPWVHRENERQACLKWLIWTMKNGHGMINGSRHWSNKWIDEINEWCCNDDEEASLKAHVLTLMWVIDGWTIGMAHVWTICFINETTWIMAERNDQYQWINDRRDRWMGDGLIWW